MAPQTAYTFSASLQMINNRLGATPDWQLPHVVPQLATCVSKCGPVWSTVSNGARDNAESGVFRHRYQTRVSTLLQGNSPQARWAAVVLVKATIEAGGLSVVRESGAWMRSMIAMLARPDPDSTKKICVATITRCFLLTQGHQSILRELTTPMLSAFLSACLKIMQRASFVNESLLLVILDALNELLPYHPSLFRTFEAQIRSHILPMLAPTPSSAPENETFRADHRIATEAVASCARRLYITLFHCASKRSEGEQWVKAAQNVCDLIHMTADRVFRAFIEDRRSNLSSDGFATLSTAETINFRGENVMGLPDWIGIHGGLERLVGLLRLLRAFMTTRTSFAVEAPVSAILEIFQRMVSVFSLSQNPRLHNNPEIGRDEREGLLEGLPLVHATAVDALNSTLQRVGHGCASLYKEPLGQCLWLLDAERSSSTLRTAIYGFLCNALQQSGLTTEGYLREQLATCVSIGCDDLLSLRIYKPESPEIILNTHESMNRETEFKSSRMFQPVTDIQQAAAEMLLSALTNLPSNFLSRSARAQIDRTAILIQHEDIILASVLYPGRGSSQSLMPFLARKDSNPLAKEGLMKPRMPVVQPRETGQQFSFGEDSAQIMQEADYANVHSGSAFASVENVAISQRGSLIEDSMRTEQDLHFDAPLPSATEISNSTHRQSETSGLSIGEVAETQPVPTANSNKRTWEGVDADSASLQTSHTKRAEPDAVTESNSSPKRLRLAELTTQGNKTINTVDSQTVDEENLQSKGTTTPKQTFAVPAASQNDLAIIEEDSDSDESSIPPIDPTPATDDEYKDEDEDEDEETEDGETGEPS